MKCNRFLSVKRPLNCSQRAGNHLGMPRVFEGVVPSRFRRNVLKMVRFSVAINYEVCSIHVTNLILMILVLFGKVLSPKLSRYYCPAG